MGLKRPFNAEEMQECNAKHARQLTYHPNQFDQSVPYHVPLDSKTAVLVDKDSDTCAPFSWISTDLCHEDAQTQSSLSEESSGSELTWRPLSPVEDVYTSLMNQPPRKLVPVGSNHQASIPECEILAQTNDDVDRKLMGKCIIPMPDSFLCEAGEGRKECLCPDKDTVRCVRRHIMEAREGLIEAIGYERFTELGMCEMGDEVISLWSEDEEDLFHRVVYSNPVSHGRDFWKQLKATFPSRAMKELVSYYFNVFILRRRATQNRLRTLDVDSDDDEWQVEYDVFCKGKSDEEEEEESNSSDDDDEEEEDSPAKDAHCVYMDKVSSRDGEVNVEDDSCLSFEMHDSNSIFSNRESHGSGLFAFDDACDGRLASSDCWTKNNDLLPTSNIMEEIFGKDEWGEDGDNLKGK
ncbi:ELM2 domain-containing protein [Hirschfeldia incana]|nr:ELM2 domain-containing protein [Hirschfeldia incana]